MLRLNSASAMINENLGWVTQCLQSYKDTAMTAKLFDWIAERKWDDIDVEKGPSFLGAHAGTFPTSPSTPSFVCCTLSETGLGNRGCYVEVRLWHVITQCFLCRNCQQLSGLISCAGEMQPITFEWFNVLRMNISFFSLRRLYVRQFNAMLPPKLYSCDCALSVSSAEEWRMMGGGWKGRERERAKRGGRERVLRVYPSGKWPTLATFPKRPTVATAAAKKKKKKKW